MKRILTSVAGVAVAVLASGGLVAGFAGSGHAAVPPPWEPDNSSVGGLTFYNAAGAVITGGSTSDSPLAAYVEGSSTVRSGDKTATLQGYLPVKGQVPGQWSGEALSGSTSYPNGSAPAPLKTATLPVVSGGSGDLTIADLVADYPNPDSTSDGYANIYQLRLVTSAPNESVSVKYDSADIEVTGSTWSVVYTQAPTKKTTTTLTVSPAKSVVHGSTVTLRAVISPAAAKGKVEFLNGSRVLKTVNLASGKGSFSTKSLPGGTARLTARYVPTIGGGYGASKSVVHSLTVKAQATRVSLKASRSSIKVGQKLTLTINESPAAAGKVAIFDGSKKIGTVKVKSGKATFATKKLKAGTHGLKATFTPSNPHNDKASTSKVVKVKVTG
jgi:hypothetical protein